MAYEAATADIRDFNMIDSFHLEAYNEKTVNYNRDVEVFPVLKRIIEKITGASSFYKSPTDMGVNRAGSESSMMTPSRPPPCRDHPPILPLCL